MFVALILVLAGGGLWYRQSSRPRAVAAVEASSPSGILSATTTRILAGQIFRVGLTRFRLEREGYQMREFKIAAQVTASAAQNARG